MWQMVRANNLGFHFLRQHPFVPYVLDFYCHKARLCVELDSDEHAQFSQAKDAERDRYLESFGILTLRLSNGEGGYNPLDCARQILRLCQERTGIEVDEASLNREL